MPDDDLEPPSIWHLIIRWDGDAGEPEVDARGLNVFEAYGLLEAALRALARRFPKAHVTVGEGYDVD